LKAQIAYLQSQVSNSPIVSMPPSCGNDESKQLVSSSIPKSLPSVLTPPKDVNIPSLLGGLGGAGVLVVIYGLDCRIKDCNNLFETISGFRRDEVVGTRFSDSPLFNRHVRGSYPSHFVKSADPIPTASTNDLSCADFKQTVSALVEGGTFKVVSRHLTRDGQILESLVTLFFVRDDNGKPIAIMAVSTPDCRRLVHPLEDNSDLLQTDGSSPELSSISNSPFSPNDFLRTPVMSDAS